MKWIEPTVFAKSCGNPDFRSIFGHQRAKNEGTNTKINRGPETNPISINPRDEMNWANSFREKLRKPCLQTDGRTDGRTDRRTDRHQGESSIPPFHLRWSGGIMIIPYVSYFMLTSDLHASHINLSLMPKSTPCHQVVPETLIYCLIVYQNTWTRITLAVISLKMSKA